MYSYNNSVHMSPTSKESTEEQERYVHDRRRDEEIRWRMFHKAGKDYEPSAEELKTKLASTERFDPVVWEMRRQEAMRARIARDEEELKNEEESLDAGDQEGGTSIQGYASEDESDSEDEDVGDMSETKLENESARGSGGVYENEEELESNHMSSAADYEDHDEQEGEENGENKGNLRPASSQFGQSEYGTAPEESDTSDYGDEEDDEPAHEDDTVFYDCTDVKSSYPSSISEAASKKAPESETSDEEDESGQVGSENNNGSPTTPITPFVPHFTAKLNDPSGKYTEEDLQVELRGIIMESYCVWLEGLRLSFTNAQPASAAHDNDPESCPHLGYWKKEFEIPECQSCHRWRPIYTLTCPGCGVNRCVGCKFLDGKQE